MDKKVILISIDGMRPDGFLKCGSEHIDDILEKSTYSLKASTIFPSSTLPCHFSLFHGVEPLKHGIISNAYVQQPRPKGLFEKVAEAGGVSSFFFGWEGLGALLVPGSDVKYLRHFNGYVTENADTILTDDAIELLENKDIDFCFLYMVDTDQKGGHDFGWMSEEYLKTVKIAVDNAYRMIEKFGDKYSIIITADHGGHDKDHGTDLKEDMTIPIFFMGKDFEKGRQINDLSILDIAPTICRLFGLEPEREWQGKSLV